MGYCKIVNGGVRRVRAVLLSLDLPYYQEIGRTGRDGAPADCVLLHRAPDVAEASGIPTQIASPGVAHFISESRCRHQALSAYFGEPIEPCGSACDLCLTGRKRRPARESVSPDPAATARFERLRTVRRMLAEERRTPTFLVLSDATLLALAPINPRTRAALSAVSGIGRFKLASFGDALLDTLRGVAVRPRTPFTKNVE